MWNLYETTFLRVIVCPDAVTAMTAYNPSSDNENLGNKVIICGGNNDSAYAMVYDVEDKSSVQLFALGKDHHRKYISSVIVHEPYDRSRNVKEAPIIIVGSADKSVSVWDLTNCSLSFRIPAEHTDLLLSIAVHDPGNGRDGLHIITGSWDKTVLFFKWKEAHYHHRNDEENTEEEHEQGSLVINNTIDAADGGEGRILPNPSLPPPGMKIASNRVIRSYYKLKGHTKSVTAICTYNLQGSETIDADCAVLATGSLDKTVIIWDVETKEKVRTLKGHNGKITSVLIYESVEGSPPIIISASEDQQIILWDLLSGEKIRELSFSDKVLSQTIVKNNFGLVLVSGFPRGKTIITNLCRTERIRKYFTSAVTAIATYTPREDAFVASELERNKYREPIVLIGTIDNSVTLFKMSSHEVVHKVTHHANRINAAVIYTPPPSSSSTPQHPLVISCDGDAVVMVWDLVTYELKKKMTDHKGAVFCLGLYEPQKCSGILSFSSHSHDLPEGKKEIDLSRPLLITGGIDRRLMIWDLLDMNTATHLKDVIEPSKESHHGFIRSIVVHHPLQQGEDPLFMTGSYDKSVIVWNLRKRIKLYSIKGTHTDYVFFIGLYDPIAHMMGAERERKEREGIAANRPTSPSSTTYKIQRQGIDEEFLRYPSLVTSSYDMTMAIYAIHHDHANLKHHLKDQHRDSITALTVYTPASKDDNPLIISGSIDRMVIVWDLFKGIPLQKLIGHTDRVCFITTYVPPPHTLTTSSASVSPLSLSISPTSPSPSSSSRFQRNPIRTPLVLSGSDDETTIVWEDSLHQSSFMPLRDDVNRCFDSDCLEEDWPLITDLVKTYSKRLFLMNSNLFFLAVKYSRPDFLLKFRSFLTLVLPLIKKYESQNLLTFAVNRNDLLSVRIILLCWTENLNRDINDMLTQRMYHPSYFFPDNDLILLAKKYPVEFKNFIISLRLIRNHYTLILNKDNETIVSSFQKQRIDHHDLAKRFQLHLNHIDNDHGGRRSSLALTGKEFSTFIDKIEEYGKSTLDLENKLNIMNHSLNEITSTRCLRLSPIYRYEVEATDNPIAKFDELWYKKLIAQSHMELWARLWNELWNETTDAQPVTSLMIPLRNTAKLKESLEVYVRLSNQLDSVDIFNSDIGIVSLRYFWDSHAKQFHVLACIKYAVFMFLYMIAIYSYEFYYLTGKLIWSQQGMMWCLNVVVLFSFFYYAYEEKEQFQYKYPSEPIVIEEGGLAGEEQQNLKNNTLNSGFPSEKSQKDGPPSPGYAAPPLSNHSTSRFSSFFDINTGSSFIDPQHIEKALTNAHNKRKVRTLRSFIEHFLLDLWNLVDVFIMVCGSVGIILRFIFDDDIRVGRGFLAICSIMMWFKVLYFMRPFSNSGPLG
jgi:WD40 repeat protein